MCQANLIDKSFNERSAFSSGGGTGPRNVKHILKFPTSNDEYVDMCPRGAVPIPNIPNRNERTIGYR